MMRIALDAMGGDFAPEAVVSGAVEALKHTVEKYEVILVGDESVINRELERHHFIRDLPISIRHASQKIEMQESPARALKLKPDAAIPGAVRMIKAGEADAMVSAGNTGAVMAASLFILKPVEGVLRPAVGAFIPHE